MKAHTSGIAKVDATTAAIRKEMVGLSEADVRMCAGLPTGTAGDNNLPNSVDALCVSTVDA